MESRPLFMLLCIVRPRGLSSKSRMQHPARWIELSPDSPRSVFGARFSEVLPSKGGTGLRLYPDEEARGAVSLCLHGPVEHDQELLGSGGVAGELAAGEGGVEELAVARIGSRLGRAQVA